MPFDPNTAQLADSFDPATASAAGDAPPLRGSKAPEVPEGHDPGGSGVTGDIWAALHGAANTATFGMADRASAGLAHLISGATGQPMSYDEALAKIRANTEAMRMGHPISTAAGDVAGFAVGGAGLARAAGAGLKALGAGGEAVADALALKRGQTLKNLGRMSGIGAAAGAADTAIREGAAGALDGGEGINPDDVATSAAVGAVAGPIGAGAAKLVTGASRTVANAVAGKFQTALAQLSPASQKAIGVIASKLSETPDDIAAASANFKNQTGRNPTMVELLGMKSQGELATMAKGYQTIGEGMNAARDSAAAQRTQSLSQIVENEGGPAQDISTLTRARKDLMDAAMTPIRGTKVDIDSTDAGLLSDPRTAEAVRATKDPNLRRAYGDALAEIKANGQSDILTVGEMDAIRQSLRNQQAMFANPMGNNHNSLAAQGHGQLADELGHLTSASEPRYADALERFKQDSDYIAGFKHGQKGRTLGSTDDPELIRSLQTNEGRSGHQAGIVTRTSDAAAANSGSNARTAQSLAEGTGDTAALRGSMGQQNFQRVQDAAGAESRGQQALDAVAPGQLTPEAPGMDVRQGAQGVAAAMSHSPAGIALHLTRAIPKFGKLAPKVQSKIVEYLTDPDKLPQGIAALRKAGARDADLRKFALAVGGNAALNAADDFGGQ